jgi:aspartyl/asparaginyl beta-hydroxylase (cupin superfamily)
VGNESIDSGSWNVFYLFLHDLKFDSNCEKCPKTVEIIEKHVPR